jgi:CubicO group peptidase (beta-lactamase class C family)
MPVCSARLRLVAVLQDDSQWRNPDGQCVLKRNTVERTTVPYSCQEGKVLRGLGWDISSPLSSPRGTAFSEASFGHTGYSGCSVWIDPEEKAFVVFLSARLDYKRKRDFNKLRSELSTVAAHLIANSRETRFARNLNRLIAKNMTSLLA